MPFGKDKGFCNQGGELMRAQEENTTLRARVAELEAKAEGDLKFIKVLNDDADRYVALLERLEAHPQLSPCPDLRAEIREAIGRCPGGPVLKRFHVHDSEGHYLGWTDAESKETALADFADYSNQLFPKPWRATTNGKPTKWQPK